MEKYIVGENLYVYNKEGVYKPAKLININDFREPRIKYTVDVEGEYEESFVGEENLARNITILVHPDGTETLIASDNDVKIIYLRNEDSVLKVQGKERKNNE